MKIELRNKIAGELMAGCQQNDEWGEDERKPWSDHQAIADAIRADESLADIQSMPEMYRWPDTCEWVTKQIGRSFKTSVLAEKFAK